MGSRTKVLIALMLGVMVFSGCKKASTSKFPDKSPAEVVTIFFKLLSDQGRLSNQEALKMVSNKRMEISADTFRKWTENLGASSSKIKVVRTLMPKNVNKAGEWVATVLLEVDTPSIFGDSFKTTSTVNCILDEKEREWKIDFLADTIDESHFKTMSQTGDYKQVESGK